MENCSQKRIMLWSPPRTVSTAFLFSMDRVDNCKVTHEAYTMAYLAGDDRVVIDNSLVALNARFKGYTYQTAREILERKYEKYAVVFAKDLVYAMDMDHFKFLPTGYQHTFLIRHPDKILRSAYSMYTQNKSEDSTTNLKLPADPISAAVARVNYKGVWDLANYIRKELSQELVVIDSDELCSYPEKILPLYCEKVGVKYTENMLTWPPGGLEKLTSFFAIDPDQFSEELAFASFGNAMRSTGFGHKFQDSSKKADRDAEFLAAVDLPKKLQDTLKENRFYYQTLFEERIKPQE